MRPSRDVELTDFRSPKEGSFAQGSLSMRGASSLSYSHNHSYYDTQDQQPRAHPVRRFLDSFRRDPGRHVTPASVMHTAEDRQRTASMMAQMAAARRSDDLPSLQRFRSRGGHYRDFDLHAANVGTANTLLSRELKGRHLQMIAIGGSIGG
jgi:amino acid transporter